MPATLDPTPLITQANCMFCVIPPGMIQYAILAALIDVGNGDPVPSDPNELIAEAKCLECVIPNGFLPYAILAAISNISGSGSGTIQVYENRDPAPPDDPTKAALNEPTGGGTLTFWSVESQAWV